MPQKSEQTRIGGLPDMAVALNILKSHGVNVDMGQFQLAVETELKGRSDPKTQSPKAMAGNPEPKRPKANTTVDKDPNPTRIAPKANIPKAPTTVDQPPYDEDEISDYGYASEPTVKVYKDKTTGRIMLRVEQELGPKVLSKSGKSYVYKVQRLPQIEGSNGVKLTINPMVVYQTIPKKLRS